MFKLTILLIFCFNSYNCYKQQPSNDYGGQSQQKSSSLKPQAIIHLPENVYSHKITDTIKLDHEQLSNYLSSINYIPHTIHKHAELLAQLNPEDIKQYGQSVGSNQLPLIELKSSDYSNADAQMKINDDYSAPQKDSYQAPQSNSGYQQQGYAQPQQQEYAQPQEYSQPKQQEYSQPQAPQSGYQQQEYAQPQQQEYSQPKQQEYSQPQAPQSGYQQQEYAQPQQQEYAQPQQQEYSQPKQQGYNSPPPSPMKKNCNKNSSYQQKQNSQEQYGNNQAGNYEKSGGNSYEANQGYNDNKPQVEYQSGGQNQGSNYDSGNSYYSGNSNSYEQSGNSYENNQGNSYEEQGGNSYENSADKGGQSYQSNNQDYGGSKTSNEGNDYGENYESSPFDYNFVQDILHHVMQQLEQLQIDPDQLNAYGKMEDSNGGGDNYQSNGGNNGGYESNENQQSGGYEVQGGSNGIQLMDKPEGSQEINYGYSINHGSYERPSDSSNNGYDPNGYASSSTTSQATSYSGPTVVLDNKLPINQIVNKDQAGSTVTYQMPTVNIALDKKKIEHIMKAISNNNNKKGSYSQPIMIKANQFKLPSNLNLGKIKTIAFISGSKLKGLSQLPYFNSQLLGSNLINNNYKLISSTSKKEETKYEANQPLSAYGYGIVASSSNKKSVVLPIPSIKKRSKILSRSSQSLQTASSNIKKTIISALPKLNKNKKSVKKP